MKAWHAAIAAHIEHWSQQLGNRGWWPRYVYHFTDIQNAARILATGSLYSRTTCLQHQLMVVDNASPEVIQQTKPAHHDYVRLYFRPRTPTQYHNEGIRPRHDRGLGSHCPVPIFFCFDALAVLRDDATMFSNGNMASQDVRYGKTRRIFETIPFHHVFHEGRFPPEVRDTIIFHRHAEVLVPEQLPLEPTIRFIVCRTAAERQTLLHLVSSSASGQVWSPLIRIADSDLFERRWRFVESVVVADGVLTVWFNPPSTKREDVFHVRVVYSEEHSMQPPRIWEDTFPVQEGLRLRMRNALSGEVQLYLDDNLAFADAMIFNDSPF